MNPNSKNFNKVINACLNAPPIKRYDGILTLNGIHYQVRVQQQGVKIESKVKLNGKWILHNQFCDWLADNNKWTELCELAKIGLEISRTGSYQGVKQFVKVSKRVREN